MSKLSKKILLIGGCTLLLYGCGTSLSENEDAQKLAAGSSAVSTYTPQPTSTAVSASEQTPEPTKQPTPTPEPIPTETPTETPAPTPSPIRTQNPPPAPTATPKAETEVSTPAAEHNDNSGNNNSGGGGTSNFDAHNNPEQQNTEDTWVLNTNSKKIHYPSCKSVPKIAPKNYATSSESLDELINRGYTTCGNCFK